MQDHGLEVVRRAGSRVGATWVVVTLAKAFIGTQGVPNAEDTHAKGSDSLLYVTVQRAVKAPRLHHSRAAAH